MTSPLHGVHVAVAGDHGDARDFLVQTLRSHGALVTVHDSARSVTRLMQVLRVNVVVIDLDEVTAPRLKMIRSVRGWSPANGAHVPIVVLFSGSAQAESRILAENIDAVVRKPVQAAELARIIAATAPPHHTRET
jgi:CheY-like chemotaxis protein